MAASRRGSAANIERLILCNFGFPHLYPQLPDTGLKNHAGILRYPSDRAGQVLGSLRLGHHLRTSTGIYCARPLALDGPPASAAIPPSYEGDLPRTDGVDADCDLYTKQVDEMSRATIDAIWTIELEPVPGTHSTRRIGRSSTPSSIKPLLSHPLNNTP